MFTFEDGEESVVYHSPLQSSIERKLVQNINVDTHTTIRPLGELPPDAVVTHVNSIGASDAILSVAGIVNDEPHLVAYSGTSWEGEEWRWLDIHHSDATKGGAIDSIRKLLGLESVICFGDS